MRAMGFHITGVPEADAVLDEYPLAVVIGMQLDQQYGIEHAFRGGWKILSRFGSLDPSAIAAADPEAFTALCRTPPAIHRFPGAKAAQVQELARLVEAKYDSDVTRIWTDAKTGAELHKRFKELPGIGDQTARILVALLAKQMGVRPIGWKAAAGDYALKGYRSAADVVDADSLVKVREFKQRNKAVKAGQKQAQA
jgi:uncharacterized HhH-GPD family protein